MLRSLLILDNTVLTNFALVDRADLLFSLAQTNCVTTLAIMQEYTVGITARGLDATIWRDLPLLTLLPAEEALTTALPRQLGLGERSAIAVAVQRGALLATDDAAARRIARQQGVTVTGTLGLLALAVRQSLLILTEGNDLLSAMIAQGYRSPLERLDELV